MYIHRENMELTIHPFQPTNHPVISIQLPPTSAAYTGAHLRSHDKFLKRKLRGGKEPSLAAQERQVSMAFKNCSVRRGR